MKKYFMKKAISFLTGIVCIFSLTACGDSGNDERSFESSRINCGNISAGDHHTIGVRSDGTVMAVGWNEVGQCDVSDWTNITAVSGGSYHTVGLKSDGTVVATTVPERYDDGLYNCGQCDVSDWTNIRVS